jgi:drug/metabolite transporter (DMT)-like permease
MSGVGLSRGLWLMIGSSFGFAVMACFVKALGGRLSAFEVVWFRSGFSLPVLLALALAGRVSLLGRRRGWLTVRAVVGFGALVAYVRSLGVLPLAVAQVLQYTSPLFSALLAPLLLGERVSRRSWRALGIAFAGLCLIARPRAGVPPSAAAIALLGAALSALAYNTVRKLRSEHPLTIVFYLPLVSLLLASAPTAAAFIVPAGRDWLWLGGIAATSMAAQMLLTFGLHAEAIARGSAATYLNVVFAGWLGWWLWGEVPDHWVWAGSLLIMVGVVSLGRRDDPAAEEPLQAGGERAAQRGRSQERSLEPGSSTISSRSAPVETRPISQPIWRPRNWR